MNMTKGVLVLAGLAGVGGLIYWITSRKDEEAAPPAPPKPKPAKPFRVRPGLPVQPRPPVDQKVVPLVDLGSASFRVLAKSMLPSNLVEKPLWDEANQRVVAAIQQANIMLPAANQLSYRAYRDKGGYGAVYLRVVQAGTQNETWYQEITYYE